MCLPAAAGIDLQATLDQRMRAALGAALRLTANVQVKR